MLLLMVGGILLRTLASIALASGGSQEEADALRWILLLAVLAGGEVVLAVGALARTIGLAVNRNKSAFAAIVPLGLLASASLVVSPDRCGKMSAAIRSGDRILSADGVELASSSRNTVPAPNRGRHVRPALPPLRAHSTGHPARAEADRRFSGAWC
ncbi:MAG: hypothetical protein R2839_01765 [Thermomicrobiales bacterium]